MSIKHIISTGILAISSLITTNTQATEATSPEQAVKNYYKAWESADADGLFKSIKLYDMKSIGLSNQMIAEEKQGMFTHMMKSLKKVGGIESLKVGKARLSEDGKHATVHISTTAKNGEHHEENMPVIKENGAWFVDMTN